MSATVVVPIHPDHDSDSATAIKIHNRYGLFGPDDVVTTVLSGGRGPADQVQHVSWGEEGTPAQPVDRPWPGRLDGKQPTLVLGEPITVEVLDAAGRPVTVSGRVLVSGRPTVLVWSGTRYRITGWAGPWPGDEHWSDQSNAMRMARCQFALDGNRAVLVQLRDGRWHVEAVYD